MGNHGEWHNFAKASLRFRASRYHEKGLGISYNLGKIIAAYSDTDVDTSHRVTQH